MSNTDSTHTDPTANPNHPFFTVVGYWPDTYQRFCSFFRAEDAQGAEMRCARQMTGVAITATFKGIHVPVETSEKVYFTDLD